jgi:hypothetical protein
MGRAVSDRLIRLTFFTSLQLAMKAAPVSFTQGNPLSD